MTKRSTIRILGLLTAFGLGMTALGTDGATPAPPVVVLGPAQKADLARIQDYLNGIKTLKAKFDQFAPDGSISSGAFILERPGHLRFDYDPPSEVLVVADGYWLTMVDAHVRQMSRWPINDTPLGVLVKENLDLTEDMDILGLEDSGSILRLTVADKKEPGKGRMTLAFTKEPLELRQWRVTDAQGQITTVTLTDTRQNVEIDPKAFTYVDPRPVKPFGPGLRK
jgi:outer membrane lipoprotein-sorting protein